jgi:hypothetical protein
MSLNGSWNLVSSENQLEFGKALGFSEDLLKRVKKLELNVKYTVTADFLNIDYTYTDKGQSIKAQ